MKKCETKHLLDSDKKKQLLKLTKQLLGNQTTPQELGFDTRILLKR